MIIKPAVDENSAATPATTHQHSVQFYELDSGLIDSLSKIILTSLGAGDGVVVIATEAHREALVRQLEMCGAEPAIAAAQQRFIALDAQQTLNSIMAGRMVDKARFEEVIGEVLQRSAGATEHGRVLAFGEMV